MGPLIGGGVGTVCSLLILSRVFGENPAYRLAQHMLIGLALGYIGAVVLRATIIGPAQQLALAPTMEHLVVFGVAAGLGLLLLPRFGRQRFSGLANYPLAVLLGVGAALALVGAIRGTLVPQLLDTVRLPGLMTGDVLAQIGTVLVAALTVLTLVSFTYTTSAQGEGRLRRFGRGLGRILVLATFGVLLAAALTTYAAALVGQLNNMIRWIKLVLGMA